MVNVPLLMITCHDLSSAPVQVCETLGLRGLQLHVKVDPWRTVWVVLGQDHLHWHIVLCCALEYQVVVHWLSWEVY